MLPDFRKQLKNKPCEIRIYFLTVRKIHVKRTREFAAQTMDEVRKAMRIDYFSDAAYIEEQAAKFKV